MEYCRGLWASKTQSIGVLVLQDVHESWRWAGPNDWLLSGICFAALPVDAEDSPWRGIALSLKVQFGYQLSLPTLDDYAPIRM